MLVTVTIYVDHCFLMSKYSIQPDKVSLLAALTNMFENFYCLLDILTHEDGNQYCSMEYYQTDRYFITSE